MEKQTAFLCPKQCRSFSQLLPDFLAVQVNTNTGVPLEVPPVATHTVWPPWG